MNSALKERYLSKFVESALKKKMVFIGGPRQVGKTTLSMQFLEPSDSKNPAYLNWDFSGDKSRILKDQLPLDKPLIVLDEIHKYKHWRRLLKGLFDKYKNRIQVLVTGSARLDHFRKGGDSLLGRYRYFRLHPFTVSELGIDLAKQNLESLLKFGGFPEPFFGGSEAEHRIWQNDRLVRVVSEDLRDLESVKDVTIVQLLAELLPSKVGSPLSLQSLVEDLQVSQPTIQRWILILCALCYCFEIAPYGAPKIRAVKKLKKLYLWD